MKIIKIIRKIRKSNIDLRTKNSELLKGNEELVNKVQELKGWRDYQKEIIDSEYEIIREFDSLLPHYPNKAGNYYTKTRISTQYAIKEIRLLRQFKEENVSIKDLKAYIQELLDYKAKYYQVISNMKV